MRKLFFVVCSFFIVGLSGCTNDEDIIDEAMRTGGIATRAGAEVVWQVQPGALDIPFGQEVSVGLDGTIIK